MGTTLAATAPTEALLYNMRSLFHSNVDINLAPTMGRWFRGKQEP